MPSKMLKREVLIYLNNILIAQKIKQEHQEKIKKILKLLTEAKLQIKKKKCEFFKKELKFLKFILKEEEVKKNLQKKKSIKN